MRSHSTRKVERPSGLQLVAAAIMRGWVRTGWRGSTGGPKLCARYIPLLHALPVTVPGGHLYVDFRDGMSQLLLAGSPWTDAPFEPSEQEVMRRLVRQGDVVFDIGAHIGLHTVLLSTAASDTGAVHAFEMNPMRLPSLRETVRHLGNATLHEVGLADRAARTTLYVPTDQSMASLVNWTDGRAGAVAQVTGDLVTLDAVVGNGQAPRPDFVKCDVEGAETAVFKGGRAIFDREDAPLILYEADVRSAVAFGLDVATATRVLRDYPRAEYSFYWVLEDAKVRPIHVPAGPDEHFNLLAVPAARRNRLTRLEIID